MEVKIAPVSIGDGPPAPAAPPPPLPLDPPLPPEPPQGKGAREGGYLTGDFLKDLLVTLGCHGGRSFKIVI